MPTAALARAQFAQAHSASSIVADHNYRCVLGEIQSGGVKLTGHLLARIRERQLGDRPSNILGDALLNLEAGKV
jgi:hypothetical protein